MVDFSQGETPTDAIEKLEKKKKEKEEEFKRLEEQRKTEIEETDEAIQKAKEALARAQKEKSVDEEQRQKDLEALEKKREELERARQAAEQGSLDELVAREKVQFTDEMRQQVTYMTDELRREESNIYALTNYNTYNQLTDIRNKVAEGIYISKEEHDFVEEAKKQTHRFITDHDYLSVKDPFDYVHRSEDVLHQIDNYVNLRKGERGPVKTRRGEL
ncbi:MAG: hypothetical protein ABIJ21_03295 [Nanoarchaeota archaeon]